MKREFLDYVEDIINTVDDVASFVENINYSEFKNDKKTIYAVIKAVEIIGEAVKNIPGEIKKHYSKIAWRDIAGIRDKLVHEYFGTNLKRVWDTAKKDIPPLKSQFKEILESES